MRHLSLPTLHVYGLRDELVPADRSLALAATFERPPAAAATTAVAQEAAAEDAASRDAEAGSVEADGAASLRGPQRYPHPGAHMVGQTAMQHGQ